MSVFRFIFDHLQNALLIVLMMSSNTQSYQVGGIAMQPEQKFRMVELTEDRIQQCAVLTARVLKRHNPIWGRLIKTQEEIYKYFLERITECLECQKELKDQGAIRKQVHLNLIYLDEDNKVVSLIFGFDAYHFKNKDTRAQLPELHVFSDLDSRSKTMIDPIDTIPGKAYYSWLGFVHEKYMGSLLMDSFFCQVLKSLNENGYRYLYTRLTNPKSIHLYLHYGAMPLLRTSLQIDEKQHPAMFVKMELNPRFIQSQLLARIQKLKAKL